MLPGSMTRTKVAALIGLVPSGLGYSMMNSAAEQGVSIWPGRCIFLAGTLCFVLACTWFSRGRGHSGWAGIFGLLGLLGLLPLHLLPDRYKCCEKAGKDCTHGAGKQVEDWSSRAA